MRILATIRKRRKFDGHWYYLDYTAERRYWSDFEKRLNEVKKQGHNYRVVMKRYPQFGVYKALYVKRGR